MVEVPRAITETVAFYMRVTLIPTLNEENNLGMFGNRVPRIIFEAWRTLCKGDFLYSYFSPIILRTCY
jgi:hypothetical protein